MGDNPLKSKGSVYVLSAITLSPADFPLGSPESRAVVRAILDSQESPIEREENRLKEAAELERAAGNPDGPANERLNRLTIFACALYEMCGVECIERPYINPGYPAPTFCEYCQALIKAGELFCDGCKQYLSGFLGSEGLDGAERLYQKALFEGWVPERDRYRPWWAGL